MSTWVQRTRPEDKARYALPATWHVGPQLLDTMALQGISRAQIVQGIVQVLTGQLPPETHRLRTGKAGNAPYMVRPDDGAVCWRAPLQQVTASARRLHYWKLKDGTIELSRVVLHDDMKP